MLTGDKGETATQIGRQCGLVFDQKIAKVASGQGQNKISQLFHIAENFEKSYVLTNIKDCIKEINSMAKY